MIKWVHQEEGYCEGTFISKFFRDDENGDELVVMAASPELSECAEKCVEAFNGLTEAAIKEICKEIINCAKENGFDEECELPTLDNALDILKYCWFVTVYVNMLTPEDEVAYVVEGESDWGSSIGFAVKNNSVLYVGEDYFNYMKEEK